MERVLRVWTQGTSHVAVCCSVLPCVAVCCCVLQCVAATLVESGDRLLMINGKRIEGLHARYSTCCSLQQCVAVNSVESGDRILRINGNSVKGLDAKYFTCCRVLPCVAACSSLTQCDAMCCCALRGSTQHLQCGEDPQNALSL